MTLPFPFGDAEIPGLRNISLTLDTARADGLLAAVDPVENIAVQTVTGGKVLITDIALPANGFSIAGLGLTRLRVNQAAVPEANIAKVDIERVQAAPITLPILTMHDLSLPQAAVDDIRSGTLDIPLRRVDPF